MLEHCWVQHRSWLVAAAAVVDVGGGVAVVDEAVGVGDADGVAVVPSSGDDGHVVDGDEIGGVGVDDGVDFGGDPLGILENP